MHLGVKQAQVATSSLKPQRQRQRPLLCLPCRLARQRGGPLPVGQCSSTRTFICVFMLAAHETRKLKRDMQTVDGHVKHCTAVPPLSFLHLPKSEDQKTDIQEGSELDFN